jgi:hypothetical protein
MTPEQLARNILNGPYTQDPSTLRILAERVLELNALLEDLNEELDDLYDIEDYEDLDYEDDYNLDECDCSICTCEEDE